MDLVRIALWLIAIGVIALVANAVFSGLAGGITRKLRP